jgi:streptomycin 6-kinase
VASIVIPSELANAVAEDDDPDRRRWLQALPACVEELASDLALELGTPFMPGGQCAWVAPARDRAGRELVLKVQWRHWDAEHEADALTLWGGDGAVCCFATRTLEDTTALVLERCVPGIQLKCSLPEAAQDVVIASVLRRLWRRELPADHPFGSLQEMFDRWAASSERELTTVAGGFDPGIVRAGIALLRELPPTAADSVLLCADLHAGNVLRSRREPWLAIDPKPVVGDPSFDVVQHMLNCDERLATDPVRLARRVAELLDLDPYRVRLWLFARCAQESIGDPTMRGPARRLAP